MDEQSSDAGASRSEEMFLQHKRDTGTLPIPRRLDGLASLLLVIAAIAYLGMSLHTLYQFPVYDGFRWYGDETWMMLAWKSLLTDGKLTVPIALHSQLLSSPGLLLGSPWIAAILYGLPQCFVVPDTDIVSVGRMVTYLLGISLILFLGWMGYRLKIKPWISILAIALLISTRSFTLAVHSARYDIITGFALLVFVGIFTLLLPSGHKRHDRHPMSTSMICFLIGSLGVLTSFTISPHLLVLIPPVMLYVAWRHGAFSSIAAATWFFSGGILVAGLLILLYAIPNHSFSIAAGISMDNQFGSVLNNLPIRHLFSWSAQSHQLWAKWYYLWHEAPLFAIVLSIILLSEVFLPLTKRPHPATSFVTISLLLALLPALFVQSTLPYYVVHILPLATFSFALHLEDWSKTWWSAPMIALASLALSALIWWRSIPDIARAGRIGNRIGEANTAAIQAAIEETSRDWEPGQSRPLVLAQGPAIHELLRDTGLRVMSESFLFFPVRPAADHSTEPVDSVLLHAGVDYVIDYDKPMTPEYETAVRRGEPVFSRVGPMLDRTIDYFSDTLNELDTLTLYQLDSLQ